jgi:hypothetical protein
MVNPDFENVQALKIVDDLVLLTAIDQASSTEGFVYCTGDNLEYLGLANEC